jgi:hypothetical protein
MPCQTMMIVSTIMNDHGSMSHEWLLKSFVPVRVFRNQFTSPYWVSKIQPQTTVADSGGIAHARRRPIETSRRHPLASFVISSAMSMPPTMISAVSTTMRPRLRASTAGKSDFVKTSM